MAKLIKPKRTTIYEDGRPIQCQTIRTRAATSQEALQQLQDLSVNPSALYAFTLMDVFIDGARRSMVVSGVHLSVRTTIHVKDVVMVGAPCSSAMDVAAMLVLLGIKASHSNVYQRLITPNPNRSRPSTVWCSNYTFKDIAD